MSGIIDKMKNMSSEEKSARAKRAALIGAEKKRNKSMEKLMDDTTNQYQILKGIPLPKRYGISAHPFLAEMEIGDSVIVGKHNSSFNQSVYFYSKTNNKKFTIRTKNNISQIWRIA